MLSTQAPFANCEILCEISVLEVGIEGGGGYKNALTIPLLVMKFIFKTKTNVFVQLCTYCCTWREVINLQNSFECECLMIANCRFHVTYVTYAC